MRHLRLLLVAFLIGFSTSAMAKTSDNFFEKRGSVTLEIQKMLADSELIIEDDFTVKVIFKVTEDMKIDVHSITSPNEEVNEFLQKRLHNQKLHGDGWHTNKVYELPVKVLGTR